ncbi:MAG: hypothetical protein AAGE03_18390, partial [Pseudomonadota bacterium]
TRRAEKLPKESELNDSRREVFWLGVVDAESRGETHKLESIVRQSRASSGRQDVHQHNRPIVSKSLRE